MKHFIVAGALALSLAFSSAAIAKDLASIDLFSGDYIGVGGVEIDQLASRDLYKHIVADDLVAKSYNSAKIYVDRYTNKEIDFEKDIDLILFAVPADYEKSQHVAIVEFKKSLKNLVAYTDAACTDENGAFKKYLDRREIDGAVYYVDKRQNEWISILSDKRAVVGTEREVKAVVAVNKAGKASDKSLKKNAALYKQYEAADKKADVWGAFVLTPKELAQLEPVVVDSGSGKSFKASEVEAGTLAIKLNKGFSLDLIAKMKSDASAADGSVALNEIMSSFLGDEAFKASEVGFLANDIAVSAAKKNLKAAIAMSLSEAKIIFDFAKASLVPAKKSK